MKLYTNSSNARRAATQIAAKFDGLIAATAVPNGGWYYPAVTFSPEAKLSAAQRNDIKQKLEGLAKLVEAAAAGETDAPVKKAKRAPKKPPRKADKAKAEIYNRVRTAVQVDATKTLAKVTKTAIALEMISKPGGAKASVLRDKLGWGTHTLRGWVSLQNSEHNRGIKTLREGMVTTYFI